MPARDAIIDNIEQYDAQELVTYIKAGIVTFRELCDETEGYFPAAVRKEVESLLKADETNDWEEAERKNDEESYQLFLKRYPDSSHASDARNAITRLRHEKEINERNSVWDNWNKTDVDELKRFISENPTDPHCAEAKRLISEIKRPNFFDLEALVERINAIQTGKRKDNMTVSEAILEELLRLLRNKKISNKDILEIIRRDNNLLDSMVIRDLIEREFLSYYDLENIGIDPRFIAYLAGGATRQRFPLPNKISRINKKSTEVYFWGIPSSGKSCALGAIMSVANSGRVARSMSIDPDCQGYGYMTHLSQLFQKNDKVGTLPESTSIYSTYEMGFDLEDEKMKIHPITCIDLAGELVRCMYKINAFGIKALNDAELEALDTLTNLLIDNKTDNRKIHFFVLEYGGENRRYEGLQQSVYLAGAVSYIERTGIFKKNTDAIYLIVTKVDKTGVKGEELAEVLRNYIDENYKGFYQGLVKICRECEINGGRVERIPFSLGKVCFKDFCLFEEESAANVVRKLMTRPKGSKRNNVQKVFDKLRK